MSIKAFYIGALGTAIFYAAATISGCASVGRVKNVEQKVGSLEHKVEQIESKPMAESSIMINKKEYPAEFEMLLKTVLDKYHNQQSRKIAESNANAIILMPTNNRDIYHASLINDVNKDGNPTFNTDRVYPDESDGKIITRFKVAKKELSQQVVYWLIYVRNVQQK